METQPRTKEGNFWHNKIYPNQVWLDGTYMAQPFYMAYETRCNGMHGCIDSYKQFMNIQKHMKDPKTGLYYHCLLYTSPTAGLDAQAAVSVIHQALGNGDILDAAAHLTADDQAAVAAAQAAVCLLYTSRCV